MSHVLSGTSPDIRVQNRYGSGGARYAARGSEVGAGGADVAPFPDLSPAKSIGDAT
jgi:hypothetical protein